MELHPILKKLQIKTQDKPVLILNEPKEYEEVISAFEATVHTEIKEEAYSFVQVFGTTNETIKELAIKGVAVLEENGLMWLCYPKKSSKTYKGSDCSRETVASLLSDQGFEPVRQVAIDEDWSALRFRTVEQIKSMTRKFAVTVEGKERTKEL
ncbi:hypothetical protein JOC85_003176 [Bacillus mesophilus]|uniref:DUF3052 domain-containing protein n=1 Tax=Bacillus mesophilus TaxID=1808955 RepID=A0A6M0Q9I2_9BACI|nr:DUF3052 domain-containing protein [Bacillus mesophilus]MBM7662369.1 hypothetical protein [Bacillus mesophilus]NEY73002.1 DUF3052 domain-containing protein [Bacillus mesophilus]